MQFVQPLPYTEALQKLGARSPIGSLLNSEQWKTVPLALRERAFFSSTIENIRFLQRARDAIADFLSGARETLPTGEVALATGSRSEFVKQMSQFAIAEGMGPLDPSQKGGLQDITSQTRLNLIFDINQQSSEDYGYWKQGMDPDVLDEFPAQRFIREVEVKTPRIIHQQNQDVVRLKTDLGFWMTMNDPSIGGFGVAWGPWGFGSGMGVEDVDRTEAEDLGLLQPGEQVKPVEKDFNDKLQASTTGLDPDLVATMQEAFGGQIEISSDGAKWKRLSAFERHDPEILRVMLGL